MLEALFKWVGVFVGLLAPLRRRDARRAASICRLV